MGHGMDLLLLKSVFVSLLAAVGILGVALLSEQQCERLVRPRVYGGLLLLQRAAIFLFAYGLLHFGMPSDIPAYTSYGRAVWLGQLPGRDFSTAYGPYFSYLVAGCLLILDHPLAIVLGMTVFEWVALQIFVAVAERAYGRADVGRALWLYLWSPMAIMFVALGGHNDAVVMCLAAMVFKAWGAGRTIRATVMAAIAPLVSKLTACWLLIPLTIQRERWLMRGILYGLVIGLGLAPVVVGGVAPPEVIRKFLFASENFQRTSGNIWFLWTTVGPWPLGRHPWLSYTVTIVALGGFWIWARRRNLRTIPDYLMCWIIASLIALWCLHQSYPNYLVPVVFPVCLLVAQARQPWLCWLWSVGSAAGTLELAFRYRWILVSDAPRFGLWASQMAAQGAWWKVGIFGIVELVWLGCCVSVAVVASRKLCAAAVAYDAA